MKQKVGILLVCTLLLTMIAPLASYAETDPLWDIKPTDWFYKSVQEMYARGMIQGVKENDLISFKPNDQVTQTQALAMVIRYLGLESSALEMTDDEIARRFQQLGIDNSNVEKWARGYIAEAIGLGYVKTKNDALSTPATRAWISQLLVRVVQKESLALDSTNANKNTGMIDDASIPSSVRGYVNAALSLNLMNGISEYGKVYFQPNGITSRAQMATLLKRLDDHLTIPTNISKEVVIKEVTSTNITVQDKDGRFETLSLNNPTVFFGNEKRNVLNLSKADKVRIAIRNQQVVFIDWLGQGQLVENVVTGTLEEVNRELKFIVVKVVQDERESLETFSLTDNQLIRDSQNRTLTIDDLSKGKAVEVYYNLDKSVKQIIVQLGTGSEITGDKIDGEFLSLNEMDKRITIKLDSGVLKTFIYDESTVLIYKNTRFATLNDLKVGDRLRLTLNDKVAQIEVIALNTTSQVVGTVVIVSDKESVITVKVDQQPKAFVVSPKVAITLSGVPNPTLTDLKEGDQVTLDLQNEQVVKIKVEARTYVSELRGRFVSVDTINKLINYRADNGELIAKELSDDVKVELENSPATLNQLTKNMRIILTVEKNKVTKVVWDNKRSGKIKDVDTISRRIVIAGDDGVETSYKLLSDATIELFGNDAPKINDLKAGQDVQFYLTLDDNIKKVLVVTTENLTVTSANSYAKIILVIKNGIGRLIEITDVATLTYAGKENPVWEDIVGQNVTFTFIGKQLVKVEKK